MAVGLSRLRTSALAWSVQAMRFTDGFPIAVDFRLRDAEFSQDLFVRNGLTVFEPFAGFVQRQFILSGEWFVVGRRVSDGAGDWVEHRFQEADDSLTRLR